MKKFRFVEVVWVDACMSDAWESVADLVKPKLSLTRGWLVGEEKDHIVLAMSVGLAEDETDHVGGTWAILRADIKKMRRLKV